MAVENIARWMRLEHEKVDTLALELRQAVDANPRANLSGWLSQLRGSFDHFHSNLVRHMEMEEREGYLLAVCERQPTLAAQVNRLKHDHVEMREIMGQIQACLAKLSCDDRLLIRDCSQRIENLLTYVEHHENDENLLVTYVFTQDLDTRD